jgi:hypothetical protein
MIPAVSVYGSSLFDSLENRLGNNDGFFGQNFKEFLMLALPQT